MLNSRDIGDLRPDAASNCRLWLDLCLAAGLNVLVTGTVRDQAYQDDCIRRGTAPKGSVPTFHSVNAGLAFDFCKNVKGQEYNDLAFFDKAARIAKDMGFSWGGDWKTPDRPHIQWDGGGKVTNADILAGRPPPPMPPYRAPETALPSVWAAAAWEWAKQSGVTDGTDPRGPCTREQVVTLLYRALGARCEE